MKCISLSDQTITVTERHIEYEPIKDNKLNLVVYKDIRVVTINGYTTKTISNGITDLNTILSLKATDNIKSSIYIENAYNNKAYICAIPKHRMESIFTGDSHITDEIIDIPDTIIDFNVYEYVLWQPFSYELFNLDGEPIPLATHLDYMNGLDNESYDLTKCLNHLDKSRVVKPHEVSTLHITEIPYYNSSEDRYLQLDFWILPTVEEYKEASKHYKCTDDYKHYYIDKVLGFEQFKIKR